MYVGWIEYCCHMIIKTEKNTVQMTTDKAFKWFKKPNKIICGAKQLNINNIGGGSSSG